MRGSGAQGTHTRQSPLIFVQRIDWCCFYYFARNNLVALLYVLIKKAVPNKNTARARKHRARCFRSSSRRRRWQVSPKKTLMCWHIYDFFTRYVSNLLPAFFFFALALVSARQNVFKFKKFLCCHALGFFFPLFCGSPIQTVLIVWFLLKHDVSCKVVFLSSYVV